MSVLTAYYPHLSGAPTTPGPQHAPRKEFRLAGRKYATLHGAGKWANGRWAPDTCRHKVRLDRCRICQGAGFCSHNTRKDKCVVCCPAAFCHHSRLRQKCRECGGAAFCGHGVRKNRCPECTSTARKLHTGDWCVVCVGTRLSDRRRVSSVCAKCDETTPRRVEHIVYDLLGTAWAAAYGEELPVPSMKDSQLLGCDGENRRPDLCWVGTDRIVHVEIDEHSHRSREVSCELAKLDQTNFGTAGVRRPTLFIRFNPDDGFMQAGVDKLCTALHRALRTDVPELGLCPVRANVCYISYPPLSKHVAAATAATDSIHVMASFI